MLARVLSGAVDRMQPATKIIGAGSLLLLLLTNTLVAQEIQFWFPPAGGDATVLNWLIQEKVPEFEREHPGIKVSVSLFAGSWQDVITTAHAAGAAPDAFFTWGRGPDEFKAWGMLAPLESYVSRWGDASDYVPSAWAANTFADGPYAIPWSIQGRAMVAHSRLMEEVGLPPAIPTTWDEFDVAARRLTKVQDGRLAQIGYNRIDHHQMYVWIHTFGGELFTPDNSQAAVNSPQAVAALTRLVELHQVLTAEAEPQALNFNNQTVGMALSEPGVVANLYSADPEIGQELIVGPAPQVQRHATRVYVPSLAIWAGSPHKDAAWAWIAFLQRPENLIAYNAMRGRLPPRLSTLTPETFAATPQYIEFANTYVRYGIPHRFPPVEGERLFAAMTAGLNAAYSGEKSPQEALDQVAHEWNVLLQRFTER